MMLNDKVFPPTAAAWLKEAAWLGTAVRHNGKMYRRLDVDDQLMPSELLTFADKNFLINHGFILFDKDGEVLVLDVERDDDGYGE